MGLLGRVAAIRSLARSDAAVLARVGERWYPTLPGQNTATPFVVASVLSDVSFGHLRAAGGKAKAMMQIDCFVDEAQGQPVYATLDAMVDEIREAIDGFPVSGDVSGVITEGADSITIARCSLTPGSGRDGWENPTGTDGSDRILRQRILELEILYTTTVPVFT